ncbi:hypothetical protein B0H14DRAFT_2646833 [Mycena olivaceomarginata]|nr:hypothetical protein B0H14DRAFT_2646833 [Mycena olivaceomarginata]
MIWTVVSCLIGQIFMNLAHISTIHTRDLQALAPNQTNESSPLDTTKLTSQRDPKRGAGATYPGGAGPSNSTRPCPFHLPKGASRWTCCTSPPRRCSTITFWRVPARSTSRGLNHYLLADGHASPWHEFAPLVRSVEELDVVLNSTTSALAPLLSLSSPAVSAFPNLTILRLSLPVWVPTWTRLAFAGELFARLHAMNAHRNAKSKASGKLRTLVLSADADGNGAHDGVLYTFLDGVAAELGVELKLEVDVESYAGIWPFFPRLRAVGAILICFGYRSAGWIRRVGVFRWTL